MDPFSREAALRCVCEEMEAKFSLLTDYWAKLSEDGETLVDTYPPNKKGTIVAKYQTGSIKIGSDVYMGTYLVKNAEGTSQDIYYGQRNGICVIEGEMYALAPPTEDNPFFEVLRPFAPVFFHLTDIPGYERLLNQTFNKEDI